LAGDSTKLRAQNSKKNNFTHRKIEKHIAYIDEKLSEYSAILADSDNDLSQEKKVAIQNKIHKHQHHKINYENFKRELENTGEVQLSTSDPDSRQLITRNNITEVAYKRKHCFRRPSVSAGKQTTVDAKNNIPIDFKVTNKNDSKAMGAMVRRAKTILGKSDFTALYDKGYHTGTEFDYAHKQGVKVIVAFPNVASHAPDITFDVEHFNYNKEQDEYTCPANQKLTTNGRCHNKASGKTINKVKHYKTKAFLTCELFERCTKNKSGRLIERSEHMDLIDANKKRLTDNPECYRNRQAIVEHPYGVIKRQWDFYYIMTKKTIQHASANVGLIFTCYNLRRIFNLIDQNTLKKFIKELGFAFWRPSSHFKAFYAIFSIKNYPTTFCKTNRYAMLKRLYLSKNSLF